MAKKLTPAELREKAKRMLQSTQKTAVPVMTEHGGEAKTAYSI